MKPLTVKQIINTLDGELIQGSEDMIIQYGAYRLKQVKTQNTILFLKKRIVNWNRLREYFPLVLVTHLEISENEKIENLTVIRVDDTEEAYWKFINYYRSLISIPVIAITGTSGKTTTKEMIRHILQAEKTIAFTNSTNNSRTAHLHYLLSINDDTDAAVFETAIGAPGDVLNAGQYFKPTIGIITNIGAHHLNYCKTHEAYINAKGEMLTALNNTGVLILNADDKNTTKLNLTRFTGKIITVGVQPSCHYRASAIKYNGDGMQFKLHHNEKEYSLFVTGYGEHQVYNALAAIAATHEIGVALPDGAHRLKTFQKNNKQLQVFEGLNGCILLDDTWSMTTTSLEAALKVLKDVGQGKKRVAILGTITDLGSWGIIIHEQAGDLIMQIGVDVLVTIGEHAKIMASHVIKKGLKAKVYSFKNSIVVFDLLKEIVDENTIILIKGDMYSKAIIDLAYKLRKRD